MNRGKNQRIFLAVLFMYLGICPAFGYLGGGKIPAASALSIIGVMLINFLSRDHKGLAVLGVMAIVAPWLCVFLLPPQAGFIEHMLASVFFVLGALTLLLRVVRSLKHDPETLAMAVSTYLLVGIGFAHFYIFLSKLSGLPCVVDMVNKEPLDFAGYIYFSFVTLSTLGYGDIVPVTSWARIFSVMEALLGVFYIAVLISRLVSKLSSGEER